LNGLGKAASSSYINNPVFVVGASRSGTSVLLQALGHHSNIISCPGEAPFLTSIGGAVAQFEFAEGKDYYNASLSCSKNYLYEALRKLALETSSGEHYGLKHYAKYCLSRRRPKRPRYWSAKTFPTHRGADALCALFPGARFVYIVRNGLEVVQSMSKYSGFRGQDFADHCRAWATSVDTFGYLADYPKAIATRHKELLNEPEFMFRRVFNFMNLQDERNATEFVQSTVVHPLDRKTEQRQEAKREFEERPAPYAEWTTEQKKIFLDICSAPMERSGYQIPPDFQTTA
jgi:hypothetical protein